jgi:plastocyanin domain-containing protein
MNPAQLIAILSGLALTVLIAWYFWFAAKAQTRVAVSASGAQEVAITVKGGYSPDVIVVQKGRPVRLMFTRQESAACSEKVLFPDFNQSALLPEGEQVMLEFTPDKPGEYGFQCQMGMLHGKLIVE